MNDKVTKESDEQSLLKLYMELTGTKESEARSVFMYTCPPGTEDGEPSVNGTRPQLEEVQPQSSAGPGSPGSGGGAGSESPQEGPAKSGNAVEDNLRTDLRISGLNSFPANAAIALLFGIWLGLSTAHAASSGPTNTFPRSPLSLADVINLALQQNPAILRAAKDVEATAGVVLQTKAIAVPKVNLTGGYEYLEKTDIDFLNFPGASFTFGNNQNWSTQIRLVQSLYEGGRMLSSFRTARLATEQSKLNYDTAVADAVLAVEIAYFDVLLAEQQITVQEASVELLNRELTDTTRRFEAGTVPKFNVLRAEVELANAKPRLIQARNSFRISKNNLANLLGFRVPKEAFEDIPLKLSGKLEAEPFKLELAQALELALAQRSELGASRKAEALKREELVSAKAGYKPSLQAFAGYDVHNSSLSQDITVENHGWIAGVQLNWSLFDGMLTRGKVKQAQALYERSSIELDDTGRRIELEVRTAFSNFIEADETLKSQEKVQEQAEEALRLAKARNEAGTGTQLDVLSAQTALTESRTTQIQALHDYQVAKARLDRAVGATTRPSVAAAN
jgi:outer membrane protein